MVNRLMCFVSGVSRAWNWQLVCGVRGIMCATSFFGHARRRRITIDWTHRHTQIAIQIGPRIQRLYTLLIRIHCGSCWSQK